MILEDATTEELEYWKELLYDDWNFGSGNKWSFNFLKEVEEEIERREYHKKKLNAGIPYYCSTSIKRPANPSVGDLYFDINRFCMMVFTESGWVEVTGK